VSLVGRSGHGDLELRRYEPQDMGGVVDLLIGSLACPPDLAPALWRWKHEQNPFGPAPIWVATDRDRVVAVRPFLAWEFEHGGRLVRAVRAVDTATHPDYRGRGLFRTLTERALADLQAGDVAFVFNTPNDQSRPGYLRMGWKTVGRLPVQARFRSVASVARLARARVPAELESAASNDDIAAPASRVLSEAARFDAILASGRSHAGLATRRTSSYLSWRYGGAPVGYRVLAAPDSPAAVFFRLRQRGTAVEATVCDVVAPAGRGRVVAGLLRPLARGPADYAVRLASDGAGRHGYLPVPRQGPMLVWRGVGGVPMPTLGDWRLCLGDVELF